MYEKNVLNKMFEPLPEISTQIAIFLCTIFALWGLTHVAVLSL